MNLEWATEIMLLLAGWISGLISPLVVRPIHRWWTKVLGRRDELKLTSTGRDYGFFTLNSWSPRRTLKPQQVDVGFTNDTDEQTWLPPDLLSQVRSRIKDAGGPSASLRALSVDHRESIDEQTLKLKYGPSYYGDLIAVSQCFRSAPELLADVWRRLGETDVQGVIHGAPKSVTALDA